VVVETNLAVFVSELEGVDQAECLVYAATYGQVIDSDLDGNVLAIYAPSLRTSGVCVPAPPRS